MEWRHQTWQCPRCLFKIGCCEGDAPEAGEPGEPSECARQAETKVCAG